MVYPRSGVSSTPHGSHVHGSGARSLRPYVRSCVFMPLGGTKTLNGMQVAALGLGAPPRVDHRRRGFGMTSSPFCSLCSSSCWGNAKWRPNVAKRLTSWILQGSWKRDGSLSCYCRPWYAEQWGGDGGGGAVCGNVCVGYASGLVWARGEHYNLTLAVLWPPGAHPGTSNIRRRWESWARCTLDTKELTSHVSHITGHGRVG